MNIGQASRESGASMKAIRRYEDMGLLKNIRRLANDYRDYSADDVRRLMFIRRARSLGFSLAQIRSLLDLRDNENRTCREVRAIALEHAQALDSQARLLLGVADMLRPLTDACDGSDKSECLILQRLDDGIGLERAPMPPKSQVHLPG